MSLQPAPLLPFDFLPSRPVAIEISAAPLTTDAGLLPVRQHDQNLRLTEQFAAALDERRDPALTRQSLMSHGDYERYQYLPIVITGAENDLVVLVGLRHGTCHAALGADDDLRYLARRLRAAWPDVRIHVRGDSGLGVPRMDEVCQELRLSYTFGSGMNPRLRLVSDDLMNEAIEPYERTGQPQRLFRLVEYQAESWPASQPVVIKAEAPARGTKRRAVVTDRPGVWVIPQAIDDEYALRGESENRNKELKTELAADRLSDHRFLANFFRLSQHAAALNLLVRLRHAVVRPLPSPAEMGLPAELPAEAIDEPDRKRFFTKRRARDPLGGGHACTWRTRLIQVAAEVLSRSRRVIVRLSASWPHLDHFLEVSLAVSRLPARCSPG